MTTITIQKPGSTHLIHVKTGVEYDDVCEMIRKALRTETCLTFFDDCSFVMIPYHLLANNLISVEK
jgi:hypothetical protein